METGLPSRPISDRNRRWLLAELGHWKDNGLLSADLVEQILAGYETTAESGKRKLATASFVLMGIAGTFIGLAVLLSISYNWEALPRASKLALIFGSITATNALAFALLFRWQAPILAEVAFFVGCLFFGAGIWLVAQVFHIDAHYPDGLWWWAVGVLPFALLLDSLLLHALYAALLAGWAGMECANFHHLFWFRGILPNGAYSLLPLAAVGFLWCYAKGKVLGLWLYVPLATWWMFLQAIAWGFENEAALYLLALGAFLLIVGELHPRGSPASAPYHLGGLALAGGTLIPLSYLRSFKSLIIEGVSERLIYLVGAVLILSTSAILLLLRFRRRLLVDDSPTTVWLDFGRKIGLPLVLLVSALVLPMWILLVDEPVGPTVLANVLMLLVALWQLRIGLRDERFFTFATGVLYFLLWAMLRYFDLFGDYGGMLGGALMFLLCGIALFGLAWFWGDTRRTKLAQASNH